MSVIVDHERSLYARWGLGASSAWHFLSPWAIWDVVKIAREDGIYNRPTESGSRWQKSGAWAVDGQGYVKWGDTATKSGDIPDINEAVSALG